ncbi:hypothetical protein [Chromatium okenii]|uniref:hypothetical protein n=1 Tax=Chromatium okenii TaxID=61644 RepID=UPI0018D56CFF|nr:hypothetical protein [Chromatium okenii]
MNTTNIERTESFREFSDRNAHYTAAICARYLPTGKKVGNEWVVLNPNRSDSKTGSFKINLDTGRWQDWATGDKGDLVGLVAYLRGVNNGKATQIIIDDFIGTTPAPMPKKKKNQQRVQWQPAQLCTFSSVRPQNNGNTAMPAVV